MVVPAVDEALAVGLVVETAHDPRNGCAAHLLPAFGRPGIVDDRVWVGLHRANECDLLAVGRPERARGAFGDRAQLARLTGREVEHEELIHRTDLAHEGETAAVRGPLRRVVSARSAGRLDRLRLQQASNHDAAAALSRIGVSPAQLIRDALAVPAQPDVVYPAKAIQVLSSNRPPHEQPPMLSVGNELSVMARLSTATYRLRVEQ